MVINAEAASDLKSIEPQLIAALARFFIECRRNFGGDIDLLLMLCVIDEPNLSSHRVSPGLNCEAWHSSSVLGMSVEKTTIQSVAALCGIPRETFRRKLNTLIARGWVTRDERGFITATDRAKSDLNSLTRSSLANLLRT
jgi:CRP-like cAMP-binding protein